MRRALLLSAVLLSPVTNPAAPPPTEKTPVPTPLPIPSIEPTVVPPPEVNTNQPQNNVLNNHIDIVDDPNNLQQDGTLGIFHSYSHDNGTTGDGASAPERRETR